MATVSRRLCVSTPFSYHNSMSRSFRSVDPVHWLFIAYAFRRAVQSSIQYPGYRLQGLQRGYMMMTINKTGLEQPRPHGWASSRAISNTAITNQKKKPARLPIGVDGDISSFHLCHWCWHSSSDVKVVFLCSFGEYHSKSVICWIPSCLSVGIEKQVLCVLNAVCKIEIWMTNKTTRRKYTLHEPGDRVPFLSLGMGGHGWTWAHTTNKSRGNGQFILVLYGHALPCLALYFPCLGREIKVRVGLDMARRMGGKRTRWRN